MARYVFDCETNGFLDVLDTVHSLVLKDLDTGDRISCSDNGGFTPVEEGLRLLMEADEVIGHNIIKFDLHALQKVYPWFHVDPSKVRDTMVWGRLVYPKDVLKEWDFKLRKKDRIPGKLIGSFKLRAWGFRLNILKGDFGDDHEDQDAWTYWSPDMQDYCEQDVEVTYALLRKLEDKGFSQQSIDLEHRVAQIIDRQERYGWLFNMERAEALQRKLVARRAELQDELTKAFPPRWRSKGEFTPKRSNKRMGYEEGVTFTKIELTPFNPGSRHHVAEWLRAMRGWKPTEYTPKGEPKVDESVLETLPFPEAQLLAEYFMVQKRLGQIAEGDKAWTLLVKDDGRLHGGVITNGAVTGRMTHLDPNVAQVPASGKPYGEECRACFVVPEGKKLVGCDADGLELRCLAGYMALYDSGAYIKVVLEGDKSQGTDMHSVNARALECDRPTAKVWFYAFVYGAGDAKLGFILGAKNPTQAKKLGKQSRRKFLKNLPALGKLVEAVKGRVNQKGFLKGLDGRRLRIRSDHAALNTLLQSAGAIIMKEALVILDADLQAAGYVPGVNYEFVGNIHDEWQIEADEEIAEDVGRTARAAIQKAGETLSFKCPLDGDYKIGDSWANTH